MYVVDVSLSSESAPSPQSLLTPAERAARKEQEKAEKIAERLAKQQEMRQKIEEEKQRRKEEREKVRGNWRKLRCGAGWHGMGVQTYKWRRILQTELPTITLWA